MIRRDWMKWLGFAAFAAPVGLLKTAEAAPKDWSYDNSYHISDDEGNISLNISSGKKKFLIDISSNSNGYHVNYQILKLAPPDEIAFEGAMTLHHDNRTFKTLDEAFLYIENEII